VSNLVRTKGVFEFLTRLGDRLAPGDEFRIRIAGRTDIEPAHAMACLRAIDTHVGLRGRVEFLGPVSLRRMKGLYERSSVFITASSLETFGMAAHEARAFGLPILGLRAPYLEDLVENGRTGSLGDTVEDLAVGALALIRAPERLAGMSRAAERAAVAHVDRMGRRSAGDATAPCGFDPRYTWRDAATLFRRAAGRIECSM
jgi:glycosyltransferase involved in cell wall biosynthesis